MVWHFWHCDPDYGTRVAQGAGIDLNVAKALAPLEGKPAPGQNRPGPTYSDGTREQDEGATSAAPRSRDHGGAGQRMRHK
jgi:catalase